MTLIPSSDADFRICEFEVDTLIELQVEAEERGWGTRWSSVDALRAQVSASESVLLQSFLRQKRGADVYVCRCLVLFSTGGDEPRGGVTTLDVDPAKLARLRRVDRDPDVRRALSMVFKLASSGIGLIPKA